MANFLVNSPNLLTEGTNSNDLIILTTGAALGATVYGNGGNDNIDVASAIAANTIINGNEGADSLNISAAAFTIGKVAGGADNDNLQLHGLGASTLTTVHGGKGADTIIFSAASGVSFTNGVINGNEGHDLITFTTAAGVYTTTRLSLGKGNDTLALTAGIDLGGSVIGGAGNDRIVGQIDALAALRIEGDSLADPEAAGNDTITLSASTFLTGSLIQGGAGADVVTLSGAAGFNGSTLNGNAGHDSITINANAGTAIYLGGGEGNDTITVNGGAFTGGFGTLVGGDGTDVINVSANSLTGQGGTVIGGAGADTINLGSVLSGTTIQSRYTTFSDSNISAFDTISASSGAGGGTFEIGQTVVSAKLGIVLANSAFTTNSGSVATFATGFAGGLTARAEALDAQVGAGTTIAFSDNLGNNYVFIQGGAERSGLEGDFIAKVNSNTGIAALAANGSGITVTFA
jgi:hypothetical protein